jgi:hypothetical protein
MISVVAVGTVTGGINLAAGEAEVRELGFAVGDYSVVSVERMEAVRRALEGRRGGLPMPDSGGSVANTADLRLPKFGHSQRFPTLIPRK